MFEKNIQFEKNFGWRKFFKPKIFQNQKYIKIEYQENNFWINFETVFFLIIHKPARATSASLATISELSVRMRQNMRSRLFPVSDVDRHYDADVGVECRCFAVLFFLIIGCSKILRIKKIFCNKNGLSSLRSLSRRRIAFS